MAEPTYVVRSYAGGAALASLVQNIGPTDLSFTISPTTGWVQKDTNPLGTAGPFTVCLDRFNPNAEKILCSAINLSTGVVTVYSSGGWNGRGYDGSAASSHVAGATVQPVFSAEEAYEANQTAAGLGLASFPACRVYRNAGLTVASDSADHIIPWDTKDYDLGPGNPNFSIATGLYTCPSAGIYTVNAQLRLAVLSISTAFIGLRIYKNGSAIRNGIIWGATGQTLTGKVGDDVHCAAADTLGVYYFCDNAVAISAGPADNWLTVRKASNVS